MTPGGREAGRLQRLLEKAEKDWRGCRPPGERLAGFLGTCSLLAASEHPACAAEEINAQPGWEREGGDRNKDFQLLWELNLPLP